MEGFVAQVKTGECVSVTYIFSKLSFLFLCSSKLMFRARWIFCYIKREEDTAKPDTETYRGESLGTQEAETQECSASEDVWGVFLCFLQMCSQSPILESEHRK